MDLRECRSQNLNLKKNNPPVVVTNTKKNDHDVKDAPLSPNDRPVDTATDQKPLLKSQETIEPIYDRLPIIDPQNIKHHGAYDLYTTGKPEETRELPLAKIAQPVEEMVNTATTTKKQENSPQFIPAPPPTYELAPAREAPRRPIPHEQPTLQPFTETPLVVAEKPFLAAEQTYEAVEVNVQGLSSSEPLEEALDSSKLATLDGSLVEDGQISWSTDEFTGLPESVELILPEPEQEIDYSHFYSDEQLPPSDETAIPLINPLQEYIDSRPVAEVHPLPFESIMAAASLLPLEETMIQLIAFYGSELHIQPLDSTTTEENLPKHQLMQRLSEVCEVLDSVSVNSVSEIESKLFVSEELNQKLLAAIEALGYPNPHEVLLSFVSTYSLELLTQTLRYLYQLAQVENRQEFMARGVTALFQKTNTTQGFSARLGYLVIHLLRLRRGYETPIALA